MTENQINAIPAGAGGCSAEEVDDDKVKDHVGEDEVGEPALHGDTVELGLVGRVHLEQGH